LHVDSDFATYSDHMFKLLTFIQLFMKYYYNASLVMNLKTESKTMLPAIKSESR